MRGGSVTVINGNGTHSEMLITDYGDPNDLSAAIDTQFNKLVCLEINCSDATPSNWTLAIITTTTWPKNTTDRKYIYIGMDQSAYSSTTPDPQQLWTGGYITLDYGMLSATAASALAATAATGTSLRPARSDHAHKLPSWDKILIAETDVEILPNEEADDEGNGYDLELGKEAASPNRNWKTIEALAYSLIKLAQKQEASSDSCYVQLFEGSITANAGGDIGLTAGGNITLDATGNVIITGIPTSNPGVTGALWSDGGTVKISS
jgi:hypothetical protein